MAKNVFIKKLIKIATKFAISIEREDAQQTHVNREKSRQDEVDEEG
jgi:hypothetical protein